MYEREWTDEDQAVADIVDGILFHAFGGATDRRSIPDSLRDYVKGVRGVMRETFDRHAGELLIAQAEARTARVDALREAAKLTCYHCRQCAGCAAGTPAWHVSSDATALADWKPANIHALIAAEEAAHVE